MAPVHPQVQTDYDPEVSDRAWRRSWSRLRPRDERPLRVTWKEEELQKLLCDIMTGIHDRCAEYGRTSGDYIDYVQGANIGAFIKVADAMLAYGVAKS